MRHYHCYVQFTTIHQSNLHLPTLSAFRTFIHSFIQRKMCHPKNQLKELKGSWFWLRLWASVLNHIISYHIIYHIILYHQNDKKVNRILFYFSYSPPIFHVMLCFLGMQQVGLLLCYKYFSYITINQLKSQRKQLFLV